MSGNDLIPATIDHRHAVEIAPSVWWVGHVQANDPFQCHVYLIEQGEHSVLIDPGSKLTLPHTLQKIEEVIPFSHIRYFICHHQDPDITAAMPLIDEMPTHPEAVLVTHWRAKMLLKHYGLTMPFWLIDEHGWRLELQDRTLEFIFTPYAHFPGAFVTYDHSSRIMFSSDLFGGLTQEFQLFAQDTSYLEAMKPFHQHYIPSNEILQFALSEIERFPLTLIAPQHGSIIPQPFIGPCINYLKGLDCGLYILLGRESDIQKLSHFNETLRSITRTMMICRDFKEIANSLLNIVHNEIQASSLSFYVLDAQSHTLCFNAANSYRGTEITPIPFIEAILNESTPQHIPYRLVFDNKRQTHNVFVPLHTQTEMSGDQVMVRSVVQIGLAAQPPSDDRLQRLLEQMMLPLQVAIEREMIFREMDRKREEVYARAIRDPLTGLFTRIYMQDIMHTLLEQEDRNKNNNISAVMMDIDHFKRINDTYGHPQGDVVLKQVAACVLENCRSGDIPVRLGGEEFITFCTGTPQQHITRFADRLRASIEKLEWPYPLDQETITASFGVALRLDYESLEDLIERTDGALYRAKEQGRNRVVMADETIIPMGDEGRM